MSLEILNRNLENSLNSTLEFGEFSKVRKKTYFESEFGEFSKFNLWVLDFFQFIVLQKKMNLEILNLSLENSSNSEKIYFESEFGELTKLENSPNSFWFLKKKHVFGILFLLNLSSGKSPNSTLEFGEFSKLNLWVCVFFKFRFFSKKMSLEILKISKLNPWVWRILQTQPLSVCIF